MCATCGGMKQVVYRMSSFDTDSPDERALNRKVKPCPDCSAAQPATEQPRIWRVAWKDGHRESQTICYSYEAASEQVENCLSMDFDYARIQYSTDNGETWIDEQAEREGK